MKETKKEKEVPALCMCGRQGIVCKMRSKKMVSCPDPINCIGNFRTMWMRSEDDAIREWNIMLASARALNRN